MFPVHGHVAYYSKYAWYSNPLSVFAIIISNLVQPICQFNVFTNLGRVQSRPTSQNGRVQCDYKLDVRTAPPAMLVPRLGSIFHLATLNADETNVVSRKQSLRVISNFLKIAWHIDPTVWINCNCMFELSVTYMNLVSQGMMHVKVCRSVFHFSH